MFPVFTLVSLLSASPAAPVARVTVQGTTCTVRPLIQGSGSVRECTFQSVARVARHSGGAS